MPGILRQGTRVFTQTGGIACEIDHSLGGGGQGEVYSAHVGDETVAVKWYYPTAATTEQRAILQLLIREGAPSARFLWPRDIVIAQGIPGFGYVMPLRDSQFVGITDLMRGRAQPTFRMLARAALGIVESYFQLHIRGYSYRDINFGNVFFDPHTGDVLICDNDNVAPDANQRTGVLGTMKFMAPEVIRGEALPSTKTDRHSLAVLLFYIFMVHHPLEGLREANIRCLDATAMRELYGTHPVFIFDPRDASNRPHPTYQENAQKYWDIYPRFLTDLFTKAFTLGLRDSANGRVLESEWRAALIRLHDSVVYCRNAECGAENFWTGEGPDGAATSDAKCWNCKRPIPAPLVLRIGREQVVLARDTVLYPHHTETGREYDFSLPTVEVARHPSDPTAWGLTNRTSNQWVATLPDGRMVHVDGGRSVRIAPETKLHFPAREGVITRGTAASG